MKNKFKLLFSSQTKKYINPIYYITVKEILQNSTRLRSNVYSDAWRGGGRFYGTLLISSP